MEDYPRREQKTLERSRVLSEAPDPEEIPDPRFPSSGRMVLVRRTARGLVGVAGERDEYFTPIPLVEDDVRQYSVSVPNLIELVRKENGIEGDGDAADAGLIPLGQKILNGYGVVEVYLSLPNIASRELAARFLSLTKPSGVKKLAVLLPCALRLPAQDRQLLDSRGISLVVLSTLADRGSLVVDWESQVIGPLADGQADRVVAPGLVVWKGREHRCHPNHELTKKQMAFMSVALQNDEVSLDMLIHRRAGAVWKGTFRDDQPTRDKVTQLLSRTNSNLAKMTPEFPFYFSLPRNRRTIVRTGGPDAD